MLEIQTHTKPFPVHGLTPAGPLPTCLDPEGVYPYESYVETSRRSAFEEFTFVRMENDFLKVEICVHLGGKVSSIYLKEEGVHCLYENPILRPTRILPRGFFIGGGLELSFPISHSPVSSALVHFETKQIADRVFTYCGERELRFGMQWTVEFSLGENDRFLTQRTLFKNNTSREHPWMSWSNAAVPSLPDTEFHYPRGPALSHTDEIKTIDWESEGLKTQAEIKHMTGFFWKEPDVCAFGAYTPSLKSGLYHLSTMEEMPGIKLWSDGVGRDERWVSQYTRDASQCVEIQAGPLVDQGVKSTLKPAAVHSHREFWFPTSKALDIYELKMPEVELPALEEVPLFDLVHRKGVSYWLDVLEGRERKAPGFCENNWAPSGLDELEEVLIGLCEKSVNLQRSLWHFQLGSYYCGREEYDEALKFLKKSQDPRALAIRARIMNRIKNNPEAALKLYEEIEDLDFLLHPQVFVEHDILLADCQKQEKRKELFKHVSALDDDWILERRADFLFCEGKFEEAESILENGKFQLLHQVYTRTNLWNKIQKALGREKAVPLSLGQDDLAVFGAYREFSFEK